MATDASGSAARTASIGSIPRIYKNPTPASGVRSRRINEKATSGSARSRHPICRKLPQNVRIEYTALSLAIPERVRFRYQLEGYEKDWQDVGTRRAAYYPKLPPGHFRFHVIASNNDGVWNQTGAVAEIVVPPAFYQAAWFEASCALAGLALLLGLYRYRLHQIAREFNMRLDERVGERTRLARDLHDTLLQGFQGLMLRLQAIDESLPEGEIKDELERTLDRGDQVGMESRKAVHDLRLSTVITNDLAAMAMRTMGDELSREGSATFAFAGGGRDLQGTASDPCETKFIALLARRCATLSVTPGPIILKRRLPMANNCSGCEFAMMEKALRPICWKRVVRAITVCRECVNEPRRSGRSWISGAGREPGRRSI